MPTFTQIGTAQVVGSGGVTSISFTSIPSTYTDLVIYTSFRGDDGQAALLCTLTFNGSSSGYTEWLLYGNGSAAQSANHSTQATIDWSVLMPGLTATSNTFSNGSIYIPNYAGSNFKSILSETTAENNATSSPFYVNAALWSNTSAITSITLTSTSNKIVQYSTAYLYGVSNA
jgi:microcompartment protein CcmK/EutM